MKIQPTGDKVLIKAKKSKDKTESGILLSEQWKSLPLEGKVLAVGPDVKGLTPGDKVLFMRYASLVLENDERLATERHMLAKL